MNIFIAPYPGFLGSVEAARAAPYGGRVAVFVVGYGYIRDRGLTYTNVPHAARVSADRGLGIFIFASLSIRHAE